MNRGIKVPIPESYAHLTFYIRSVSDKVSACSEVLLKL